MTVRHLKTFLAVYRNKGITAAARYLHISQPAVSVAIRELEEHYGIRLFERYARRLLITPAGETLYHYASQVVAGMEEMESELMEWDDSGQLRLGSSITMGAQIMPQLVQEYQRRYPNVKLHILTSGSKQIEQGILSNDIDLAILEGTVTDDRIHSEAFMQDELGVFCAKTHPLSKKDRITLQELGRQKLLLREPTCGTREYIESCFDIEGIRITPMWESMGSQALVNAAAYGLGVTILPLGLVKEFSNRNLLKKITVEGIDLKREYRIIHHKQKTLSKALLRFIELCKAKGKEIARA